MNYDIMVISKDIVQTPTPTLSSHSLPPSLTHIVCVSHVQPIQCSRVTQF